MKTHAVRKTGLRQAATRFFYTLLGLALLAPFPVQAAKRAVAGQSAASASPTGNPPAEGTLDGAHYQLGFTSEGSAERVVLAAIAEARKQIEVAAYSFTNWAIADALITASRRGVLVRITMDAGEAGEALRREGQQPDTRSNWNRQARARTVLGKLRQAKVAVHGYSPMRGRNSLFHNKFLVIDARHVQTGSFNYTQNAACCNAENVLWIRNAPSLAHQYQAEWQRGWDAGQAVR